MEDIPHNENRPKEILHRVYEALKTFEKRFNPHKRRNSNIQIVRHGSIDFSSDTSEIKRSRGISVCTPSK